jgi:hypothetical protein
MTTNDEDKKPAFKSLLHLICRDKIGIGTLASAIEKKGIQGWDRFGRFKEFTLEESIGDDAVRLAGVLDTLAEQYAWDGEPGTESPIEEYDRYACDGRRYSLDWGWLESKMPLFSAIVAEAAGEPVEPLRKPSVREENNDKVLIGILLQVLLPKAGFSQATLIDHLINNGYDSYEGITKSTLETKFAKANSFLLPKQLRK